MREWTSEMEIHHCKGTKDPRLFNFNFKRKGGHAGYSTWMATFREDELKELQKIIRISLSTEDQTTLRNTPEEGK